MGGSFLLTARSFLLTLGLCYFLEVAKRTNCSEDREVSRCVFPLRR